MFGYNLAINQQTSNVSDSEQSWLDSSDIDTIIESGGLVSEVGDKTGRNNNGTQGTGSAQPTTGASTQNGKNILDYDGGDSLVWPSGVYNIPNGDNTCFIVARANTTGATRGLISMGEASNDRYVVAYGSTDNVLFRSNNDGLNTLAEASITTTNFNIITLRRKGTTQAISINGGAEVTNLGGSDEVGIDAATIGILAGGGNFLLGSIAEIKIYNRSLSSAEILQIKSVLTPKWAV